MKIGVIGGGNIGSVLSVRFSQDNDVTLYLNAVDKPELYQKDMQVYCADNDQTITGKNLKITTSLKELAENSTYIFITYPSFLFAQLAEELVPYLNNNHHLVIVPGSGGAELFFKDALLKGATITGLQRVHCVARIVEKGKLVKESGIKSKLKIASIPSSFNKIAAKELSELYHLPIEELGCYLNVTFVNSNPILHTSRLYCIFKEYPKKKKYDSLPLFYEGWDEESASLLIKMDNELFEIINVLEKGGLDISGIEPLLTYYESHDASSLANKLQSIKAFKGIGTPSIKNSDGTLSPDFSSRYFTADYPFGVDILLAFGHAIGLEPKNMQMVSDWYHHVSHDPHRFELQKFGLTSIKSIVNFYK